MDEDKPQIRLRGAWATSRAKLCGSTPHRVRGATPAQFAVIPSKLSYWLNNKYGDCVTAEEAFAKACYNPEIFIQDSTVQSFAQTYNLLNGADLLNVIQLMESHGFQQDGETYTDGSPTSIDYTNAAILQNAISLGPVKIGVAASQLENVVGAENGWFAVGFRHDSNEDHCVSLCGYGPISWLAQKLGVSVPSGVDGTQPGYLLFTWDTIGIIDVPSMLAITGEAWLRNPTTMIAPPVPVPVPVPVPPTPVPVPVPPTPPVPPVPVPPVPPMPTRINTVGDLVAVLGRFPANEKVEFQGPFHWKYVVVQQESGFVGILGGSRE